MSVAGSAATIEPAVRWIRDSTNADIQARWSAALGGAVLCDIVGRRGAVAGGEGAGVDSVAVVSWNVAVGGGDLVRLVEDLRAGRHTDGRPVHELVLLLQEIHRAGPAVLETIPGFGPIPPGIYNRPLSGTRMDVEELAARLSLFAFYVPSMRNGALREDRGNAILSTLPLRDLWAVELPFEAQRRVAAVATLGASTSSGAEWRLRVASVHLDLWSRRGVYASLGGGRLRQAAALVAALDPAAPTVLAGDLNTWCPREEVLPYLRRHFPQSPPADWSRTHTSGRRLDHLFCRIPDRWTAGAVRLADRYGSDHFPLLGWVNVGAAGT